MSGWWLQNAWETGGFVSVFTWVFWVIASIVLHELAHGWAALWEGDQTPRERGHLTINPWVHMGPFSLLAFAVMGIAWGLMPVDPSRFRHRRWGRLLVALAGPAMNVALAMVTIVAAGAAFAWAGTDDFGENLRHFLYTGAWLNLLLAAFNLLPIPPLDGSVVLSSLSPQIAQFYRQPKAQIIGLAGIVILIYSGVFDVVLMALAKLTMWGVQSVAGVFGA